MRTRLEAAKRILVGNGALSLPMWAATPYDFMVRSIGFFG
jgi:hypothetical protein